MNPIVLKMYGRVLWVRPDGMVGGRRILFSLLFWHFRCLGYMEPLKIDIIHYVGAV